MLITLCTIVTLYATKYYFFASVVIIQVHYATNNDKSIAQRDDCKDFLSLFFVRLTFIDDISVPKKIEKAYQQVPASRKQLFSTILEV